MGRNRSSYGRFERNRKILFLSLIHISWNPERTLAVLSIHGDSPRTHLTGYGRANLDWGTRTIEGIPSLMVMGEDEWWEDRLITSFDYQMCIRDRGYLILFAEPSPSLFHHSLSLYNRLLFIA